MNKCLTHWSSQGVMKKELKAAENTKNSNCCKGCKRFYHRELNVNAEKRG